jgi:hypothetical protein
VKVPVHRNKGQSTRKGQGFFPKKGSYP